MPVIDGLPGPVGGRQIAPGSAGAGAPDDPVDHRAVVNPAASSARSAVGKQRLQHRPLLVGQVMPVLHPTALHPKLARSLRQALAVPPQGKCGLAFAWWSLTAASETSAVHPVRAA